VLQRNNTAAFSGRADMPAPTSVRDTLQPQKARRLCLGGKATTTAQALGIRLGPLTQPPIIEINNPQQSWGFEWEPPKAVMKDSGTRDWTLWGGKLQLHRLRVLGIGTVISSLRLIVETKYALFQN
jgi:hypothetical protein